MRTRTVITAQMQTYVPNPPSSQAIASLGKDEQWDVSAMARRKEEAEAEADEDVEEMVRALLLHGVVYRMVYECLIVLVVLVLRAS